MVLNTRIIIIEEKRERRRHVGCKGGWRVGWGKGRKEERQKERREDIYMSYFWYGFNLVTLIQHIFMLRMSGLAWFVGSSVTLETGGRDERGFFGRRQSGSEPHHPPWLSLRHLSLALNHTVTFYLHVWPLDTAFLHAEKKASSSWTLPYSLWFMIVSSFFIFGKSKRKKNPLDTNIKTHAKKKEIIWHLGVVKLWLAPITLLRLSDCRSWKRKLGGECWLLSRRWRRCSVHVDRSARPLGVKKMIL